MKSNRSEIEEFMLGGNQVHQVVGLTKARGEWEITVAPQHDIAAAKMFVFTDLEKKSEEFWLEGDEQFGFPVPFVGMDAEKLPNGQWLFCLNACEVEWIFVSNWPEQRPVKQKSPHE